MQRVPGTHLWSRTWQVPRTARGMYLLSWPQGPQPNPQAVWTLPGRDGITYELFTDPLSRLKYAGTLAPEFPDRNISAFEGAAAPKLTYLEPSPTAKRGKVLRRQMTSAAFAGARELSIYLPPGYQQRCSYPWLLAFDAEQFVSLLSIQTMLDNMIDRRVIPPTVAVLIHSGTTRLLDLPPNDRMQTFLRNELMPWTRANFGVSERNDEVAIAGFSHGGLAAMHAGLLNSDVIGNVIAQSGSFWWAPDLGAVNPAGPLPINANRLSADFARSPRLPLRIYMDVGTWEGHFQIASNRQLRDVLLAREYPVTYAEFEGPHDYVAWRATLPNALIATLGAHGQRDACAAGR
ncbi:MAG: hypothetical protein JNL55_28125 [Steroidobacter sp.]|nr:hypothetical protein [Steroidobacter sp.]